jgi:hypothetical protein
MLGAADQRDGGGDHVEAAEIHVGLVDDDRRIGQAAARRAISASGSRRPVGALGLGKITAPTGRRRAR